MVHVAKYLNPSVPEDAPATDRELEAFLDRLQPGWRGETRLILARKRQAAEGVA